MSIEKFDASEVANDRIENAPGITADPEIMDKQEEDVATPAKAAQAEKELVEPSKRDMREGKAVADGVQEAVRTVWGKEVSLTDAQQEAMQESIADLIANIKARLPWGAALGISLTLMALPVALPLVLKRFTTSEDLPKESEASAL